MMKIVLLILLSVAPVFSQLVTRPGKVTESTSKLDGERQVSIHPAWVSTGKLLSAEIKLGGFWTDQSATNFLIDAVFVGSHSDAIESVRLGIDGEILELLPAENSTTRTYEVELSRIESSRRFIVPLSTVERMVAGTNVVVQLNRARDKTEGTFSKDGANMARPAFRKALEKIQKSRPKLETEAKNPINRPPASAF